MKTKQNHFYVCLVRLSDEKNTNKEMKSIFYYGCII